MTALRTGNDCRRGCAPGANCVTSAPPEATISLEHAGVALGIGDVDAGAEHGHGAAARPRDPATSSAPRCDGRVDAERAAGDDVDAGARPAPAPSSRAVSSPRAVAARAPTRATALRAGAQRPAIHSGDGGSTSADSRAG